MGGRDATGALRQILDAAPDVAVIDVWLPDIDGFELARRVRATSARLRLLALTGYGDAEHSRIAMEAGFDAHLVKPVELGVLLALPTAPGLLGEAPSPHV
jgi:DNA-binding response OmpR family regulator